MTLKPFDAAPPLPARQSIWAGAAAVALLTAAALSQSGCKSCGKEEPAVAPVAAPADQKLGEAAVAPAAAATAAVAIPEPVSPEVYPGPRSESLEGWKITTGFSNLKDEAVTQPSALEDTKVYVTVLNSDSRPVGQFDKLERAELHVFLVARDLRYAVFSHGSGAVREGADARSAVLRSPEGGDHALVAVFKPTGQPARVVSAPLSIKGVLPEVMGPGLGSLSNRGKSEAETLVLTTVPGQLVVGQPAQLFTHDLKGDTPTSEVKLPYAVILNDQLGWGDVVEWDANGKATWVPRKAGDFLVLAPPTRGVKALAFRVHVDAPPAKP